MTEKYLTGHTYVCYCCNEEKEIPLNAVAEEYGYFFHGNRCCSYTCMRKLERKEREDHEAAEQEKLLARFKKIYLYVSSVENGMSVEEAADKAGYRSTSAANTAYGKVRRNQDWKIWKAGRDAALQPSA